MQMRTIAFLIAGLALGGCMQETLEPSTQVGWNARDKQLMSNLPYEQAAIPEAYKRHIVDYTRQEAPGTILVDSDNKFLYYVLPKGHAIRYASRSAKKRRSGAASPRSAAWKNGRRGLLRPASRRDSDRSRPSSPA